MKQDVKREEVIKRNAKKRTKRRKKRLVSFLLVLLFLVLCVGAVLSVTVLFPIENIIVEGNSVYSEKEIIKAGAITTEDNLILVSCRNTENLIASELPKSGEVKVEKIFPDTVKITVNNAVPAYFFTDDNGYCVADDTFKANEYVADVPAGCVYIRTAEPAKIELGQPVAFLAEDSEMIERICALTADKPFKLTGIDLRDKIDIKISLDGKYVVSFGGGVDLEQKMAHLEATYAELADDAQGLLILNNWTSDNRAAVFRDTKVNVMEFCEQSAVGEQ